MAEAARLLRGSTYADSSERFSAHTAAIVGRLGGHLKTTLRLVGNAVLRTSQCSSVGSIREGKEWSLPLVTINCGAVVVESWDLIAMDGITSKS